MPSIFSKYLVHLLFFHKYNKRKSPRTVAQWQSAGLCILFGPAKGYTIISPPPLFIIKQYNNVTTLQKSWKSREETFVISSAFLFSFLCVHFPSPSKWMSYCLFFPQCFCCGKTHIKFTVIITLGSVVLSAFVFVLLCNVTTIILQNCTSIPINNSNSPFHLPPRPWPPSSFFFLSPWFCPLSVPPISGIIQDLCFVTGLLPLA